MNSFKIDSRGHIFGRLGDWKSEHIRVEELVVDRRCVTVYVVDRGYVDTLNGLPATPFDRNNRHLRNEYAEMLYNMLDRIY